MGARVAARDRIVDMISIVTRSAKPNLSAVARGRTLFMPACAFETERASAAAASAGGGRLTHAACSTQEGRSWGETPRPRFASFGTTEGRSERPLQDSGRRTTDAPTVLAVILLFNSRASADPTSIGIATGSTDSSGRTGWNKYMSVYFPLVPVTSINCTRSGIMA